MLKCPNPDCGAENVDGTQFCEVCGEELAQPAAAASTENQVKCPQCGEMNPADYLACEACGAELHPGAAPAPAPAAVAAAPVTTPVAKPEELPAPAWENDPAPAAASAPSEPASAAAEPLPAGDLKPGLIKLVVEQGQTVGAQFVLGDPELLVGREDEEEEIYPDIDLSDQDAGYVHRRHALLRFDNGNLSVTHLGGANRTRINNRPIPDNEPQPVKLGDKIAFGKVVVRVLPA